MKEIRKLFKRLGLISGFFFIAQLSFAQDAYMADTAPHTLFKNFVGLKFFAADYGATSANQDLQFKYVSVNPSVSYKYTFNHDMNVSGLKNFINLGLGMEENLGKHLVINFFNTSIGYLSNTLDWNVGAGAGYFISLNKKQTWRMNASLNLDYQVISYGLGSYYDTTLLGFVIDGVNIGTSVKNVKYVNSIFTLSPGIEFMYRMSSWDFFAGAYYNYEFYSKEKVTFYIHSIPISEAIYEQNGDALQKNAVNINNYIINIGIIREFGI